MFTAVDAEQMLTEARTLVADGVRVGLLLLESDAVGPFEIARMPGDASRYAQRLYAALHELDDLGCGVVFVERVPHEPEWLGIRDRLERASRR